MHKILYESDLKGMSHFQDPDVNGRGIQREVLQQKKAMANTDSSSSRTVQFRVTA